MSDTKNRICKSEINSAKNDRKIRGGGKIKYGIIRNTKNTRQEEIIISTKQISIAICDGNSWDAGLLEDYIRRSFPDAEITKLTKGQQLIKRMSENPNQFHLIFLEIEFSDDNGIRVAQEIRKFNKTVGLVFVAENENYYRQAFDVFALQYLLKPIDYPKLKRVLDFLDTNVQRYYESVIEERVVCFRYRSQFYTIKHSDIQYISSSLHTVNFYMEDGSVIHCRGKLSDFENQLKDSTFLRCHQSFFVNLSKTMGMKADGFIMKDITVPISRTYLKESQRQYREYLNQKDMVIE